MQDQPEQGDDQQFKIGLKQVGPSDVSVDIDHNLLEKFNASDLEKFNASDFESMKAVGTINETTPTLTSPLKDSSKFDFQKGHSQGQSQSHPDQKMDSDYGSQNDEKTQISPSRTADFRDKKSSEKFNSADLNDCINDSPGSKSATKDKPEHD